MTEHDAFEVRLHAAVRDYVGRVSSNLDAVEFAHRIAASEPRRRGLAAPLTWRGVTIPRLAWVLLLLAALLIAMVAGMLIAGSQAIRPLPAVVPPIGQPFACPAGSTPDTPSPVDQTRPPQVRNAPTAIAFDRRAGRLVVLVIADTAVETWTFDVCTNTWTQMHPNREPPGFERAGLIYDVDSDVSILVTSERVWVDDGVGLSVVLEPYSRVWAYDLQTDTWTEKGPAPIDATDWAYAKLWAYDSLSGLVVAALGPDLWSYDVETDTWTPIHQANVPGDDLFPCVWMPCVAYDASVDRIIAYTDRGPETWLLDLRTGTWSRSLAGAPSLVAGWDSSRPAMEYDEAAGRTVVFGGARLGIYDAKVDRWEILTVPEAGWPQPIEMVYDTANRRFIGMVTGFPDVRAFDLATREWTVLLEPSEEQPAPSSD